MGYLRQAQGTRHTQTATHFPTLATPKRVRSYDLASFLRRTYLEIRLLPTTLIYGGKKSTAFLNEIKFSAGFKLEIFSNVSDIPISLFH